MFLLLGDMVVRSCGSSSGVKVLIMEGCSGAGEGVLASAAKFSDVPLGTFC